MITQDDVQSISFGPCSECENEDHCRIVEHRKIIKQLLKERDAALSILERMNERMRLINGTNQDCIDNPLSCKNHSVMEAAQRILAKMGEVRP